MQYAYELEAFSYGPRPIPLVLLSLFSFPPDFIAADLEARRFMRELETIKLSAYGRTYMVSLSAKPWQFFVVKFKFSSVLMEIFVFSHGCLPTQRCRSQPSSRCARSSAGPMRSGRAGSTTPTCSGRARGSPSWDIVWRCAIM